jgi:hypothetical protein
VTQRLNKNGIPILDPPGENRLKRRQECIPGEHIWGRKKYLRTVPGDWVYNEPSLDVFEVTCQACDTKDEFSE